MRKTFCSYLSCFLSAAFIFSGAASVSASVMTPAPEFEVRTETPVNEEDSADYRFYYSPENVYNTFRCPMPNCTAYAWGRIFEIHGTAPELSRNNAARWYGENIESGAYSYGCEPKNGAVKCIEKTEGTWGHVSVIEEVYEDGMVFVSESQNKGAMFTTYTEMADSNAGYRLLGFIYPDEQEAKFYGDGFRMINSAECTYLTRSDEQCISLENRNQNSVSQNFRFEPLENGNYRIYSYSTNLVLTRTEDGVVFAEDEESSDSEWSILTEINSLWTVCTPDDTNQVLTFADEDAFVSEYTASPEQFWSLERFSGTAELNTKERSIVFSLDCTEARTDYYTDEFLDLSGIRFFLNGNQIENVAVSKLAAFYDFTEPGRKTVTVKYGPSSISFDVNVTEPEDGTEVIRNSGLRTSIINYIFEADELKFSSDFDVNGDGFVNAADVVSSAD